MMSVTVHLRGNETISPSLDGEFRWITISRGENLSLIFGGVDADTIETCDKLISALEAIKESLPTPTRQ